MDSLKPTDHGRGRRSQSAELAAWCFIDDVNGNAWEPKEMVIAGSDTVPPRKQTVAALADDSMVEHYINDDTRKPLEIFLEGEILNNSELKEVCHKEREIEIQDASPHRSGSDMSLNTLGSTTSLSSSYSSWVHDTKHARRLRRSRDEQLHQAQSLTKNSDALPHRENLGFACHFRKHDPQKYNIYDSRTCALSRWVSIPRIKEHLYRYHRAPPQCPRCKQQFGDLKELESHHISVVACEYRGSGNDPCGITHSMLLELKSRKKARRDQSDTDRWRQIYTVLFPGEQIPSPYFEPILDESVYTTSPQSVHLALGSFESYCREALPRVFHSSIENEMDIKSLGISDQLTSILQSSMDRVLSDYRSSSSTGVLELPDTNPPVTATTTHASSMQNVYTAYSTITDVSTLDFSTSTSSSTPVLYDYTFDEKLPDVAPLRMLAGNWTRFNERPTDMGSGYGEEGDSSRNWQDLGVYDNTTWDDPP